MQGTGGQLDPAQAQKSFLLRKEDCLKKSIRSTETKEVLFQLEVAPEGFCFWTCKAWVPSPEQTRTRLIGITRSERLQRLTCKAYCASL